MFTKREDSVILPPSIEVNFRVDALRASTEMAMEVIVWREPLAHPLGK